MKFEMVGRGESWYDGMVDEGDNQELGYSVWNIVEMGSLVYEGFVLKSVFFGILFFVRWVLGGKYNWN